MPVSLNRERRRRVVLDEAIQGEFNEPVPVSAPEKTSKAEDVAPSYSEGARRRFQLRTTDLIPKRFFTLVAVVSVLLSAILGIVLLDGLAGGWKDVIGQRGVDMFTIGLPSSLSTWFSALILILTSIACLQIYVLRQHRRDDYRGVYRWWLWMAVILLFASLNNVVGIVEVGMTALGHLFKSDSAFTTGWGWAVVKFGVLAMLIGRFGFEMRVSRGALVGCGLIFAIYSGALVVESSPGFAENASQFQVTFGNLLLLGQVTVFSVILVFSRYIYLEAHGLVKPRVKPVKKKKTAKKKPRKSRTENSSSTKTRPKKTARRKTNAAEKPAEDEDDSETVKPKPAAARRKKATKSMLSPLKRRQAEADDDEPAEPTRTQKQARPSVADSSGPDPVDDEDLNDEIQSLQGKSLSKSERRRLKKLQRRQNQKRAA